MARRHKHKLFKQRVLVIDAHNVCYQDAELKHLMHHDIERARRLFEQRVGQRPRCHIFYDGGPGGEERRQHNGSLSIHYSGTRSADDCIAEWLSYQDNGLLSVVTDDRHLQMRVKQFGAKFVTVNEFLNSLTEEVENEIPIDQQTPDQDEIDFWKDQFGVD